MSCGNHAPGALGIVVLSRAVCVTTWGPGNTSGCHCAGGGRVKGTVLKCLGELVKEKFGEAQWRDVLVDAGLPADSFFSPMDDIADSVTFGVIGSTCKVL